MFRCEETSNGHDYRVVRTLFQFIFGGYDIVCRCCGDVEAVSPW